MKNFFLVLLIVLFNFGVAEDGMAANFDTVDSIDEIELDGFGEFFPATLGRIYIEPEFLDGNLLKLSIVAEDIESPVIGLAFHLVYDKENVSFLRYDPGDFLERGGDPFYLVKDDKENSKIIFGETLRRDDSFPIGGDRISDFYFQILNWDKFAFTFDKAVVSGIDSVRQDLDQINFENLFLDQNYDDRLKGSFDDNSEFSVNLGTKNFNFKSNYGILILMALAVCGSLILVYFIKKQEKKRHTQYVNFK